MTEEFRRSLEEAHADELADIDKYRKLSETACDDHVRGILHDISHEEKTHAQLIKYILDMGV